MESNEWLKELKVGDTVFVTRPYGQCAVPRKVIRLMPTMICIGFNNVVNEVVERRFRKMDGRIIGGDSYSLEYLTPDTPGVALNPFVGRLKERKLYG